MVGIVKQNPWLVRTAGAVFTGYMKLIRATSKISYYPEDAVEKAVALNPAIFAMWHGEHLLMPVGYKKELNASVLISKSADGEMNAIVAENFGIGLIRGSGSHNPGRIRHKGGTRAFLQMLKHLQSGGSMTLTADVPKKGKIAGEGIVLLAQKSGRPIIPIAAASNRFYRFNSWDKAVLNFPFSKVAVVAGDPIWVPEEASPEELEEKRLEVQHMLDAATKLAYEKSGNKPNRAP